MSQIFKAILAALAVTGTLGAVQLASGHDLTSRLQLTATPNGTDINRAAKADRAAVKAAAGQTETITIRTVGLDDTSVVVRVPVVQEEARNRSAPPAKPDTKPGKSQTAIACEPPVSVLTEIAKLLQPGRCVT
ncbi:hypothetical protein [Bradyrhizobium australiense]|uniref:Uncharacterized protein n=1 Tax=Bradyrhizobium australiense TaxID=2721161 RepID=A0A7Y4GTY6_9BRAD|nr:hypothetical protein [Bradyrhizobium australiense]NOJ41689.1 hypothetical protein [Bradyrhizobium australiense]